jgi:NADH:ubiquinone oxidoreductase subunit 2 (subunit N)
MAYTTIAETGFLLLAVSLAAGTSANLVFLFFVPRGLSLAIWALSLAIMKMNDQRLRFSAMQGIARIYPLATAGLILATLSNAGFPLLAGFPPRLALWEALAHESIGVAIWYLVGILGLLIGAVRMLAVLVMEKEETPWGLQESLTQRGMLGVGIIGLFILGLFPQAVGAIIEKLPLMFTHLNR